MNKIQHQLFACMVLLVTIWVISSCTSKKQDLGVSEIKNYPPVNYTTNIAPFIALNCACHLSGGKDTNIAFFPNYDTVKKEANRISTALSAGGKMYGYATTDQVRMVKAWIYQNYPQGASGGGPTSNITYNTNISPILAQYCFCHISGGTDPNLSSYAMAKTNAADIQASISPGGSMLSKIDQTNATKLINNIKAWVTAGYPQ